MYKLVALTLLAAHAAAACGADDLAVEVERKGRSFAIRAGATVAAPVSLVWEVLTDYEKLPQFIPGISKSIVQAREANRVVVEQNGEVRFLVFSFPIEVRLEVRESPQTSVVSRAVAGNLRRMEGRNELDPDGGSVRLRYSGEMEPDFGLPPVVGSLLVRSMVEEQFTAMVAEIERRAAPAK
jgi:carbon monoxide dehydrogenase subunit G